MRKNHKRQKQQAIEKKENKWIKLKKRIQNKFSHLGILHSAAISVLFLVLCVLASFQNGILAIITTGLLGAIATGFIANTTSLLMNKYLAPSQHTNDVMKEARENHESKKEKQFQKKSIKGHLKTMGRGISKEASKIKNKLLSKKKQTTTNSIEDNTPVEEDFVLDDTPTPVEEDFVLDDIPAPVEEDFVLDDIPAPVEEDSILDDIPGPVEEKFDSTEMFEKPLVQLLSETPIANFKLHQNYSKITSIDLSALYVKPGLTIMPQHFIVHPKDIEIQQIIEKRMEAITGCKPMFTNRILDGEEKKVYLLIK